MSKFLAALLLALTSPASAGGGGGPTVRYVCAGNTRIQATYTGPHARLVVGRRVLELTRARSGSGVRYVGGGYTWWTDGGVAELYRGETLGTLTSLRQCQEG
ncbi:MliC family protein [Deinococcus aestuarii]|uniref:MliC family protein n=1 Tax=Deinococcus aestuarii TaxID=2774531 RepID=UPI001C0C7336|nr:MliC family protein [Deinococcus aestuarii]